LGYWFTEAGHEDRFARLADSFEDGEASGFELRDGYFFHGGLLFQIILWSMTMVNLDSGRSSPGPHRLLGGLCAGASVFVLGLTAVVAIWSRS
jgi:hypothetical protein